MPMKLTFTTPLNKEYTVSAEPTTKVSELLKSLGQQTTRDPSLVKIVFQGTSPSPDATVADVGFKETSFILAMMAKTAEEIKRAKEALKRQEDDDDDMPYVPTKEKEKTEPKPEEKPKVVEQPKVEQPKVEQPKVEQPKVEQPKVVQPKEEEKLSDKVEKLEAMGFTKQQAEQALKTANNNLEQAVDILTSGALETKPTENVVLDNKDMDNIKSIMEVVGVDEETAKNAYIETGKNTEAAINKLLPQ